MQSDSKTLDEQFVEWLKERNANIQYLCIGPKGGAVTIDNFITPTGTNIPSGWMITISLVEAKSQ